MKAGRTVTMKMNSKHDMTLSKRTLLTLWTIIIITMIIITMIIITKSLS